MDFSKDVLRGKFTEWVKVVVKRAKIDYIRRLNRHSNEISIDDEQLTNKLIYEPIKETEAADSDFAFNNERLFAIFKKMAPKRRQVLEMLFVHNMTPEEISVELQCTLQHVYNLRSLAIKELKNKLDNEEF